MMKEGLVFFYFVVKFQCFRIGESLLFERSTFFFLSNDPNERLIGLFRPFFSNQICEILVCLRYREKKKEEKKKPVMSQIRIIFLYFFFVPRCLLLISFFFSSTRLYACHLTAK